MSRRQYSLDDQGLTVGAGIIQIVHYANETSDKSLVDLFIEMQRVLKSAKTEFFDLIVNGLGYFGIPKKPSVSVIPASSPAVASEVMKGQVPKSIKWRQSIK